MEHPEQNVNCTADGRRLDVLLAEASGHTRSRVARLIAQGRCLVDGQPETKAGAVPGVGAAVQLTIPAPTPAQPQAEDIPLTTSIRTQIWQLWRSPAAWWCTRPPETRPARW